MRHVHSGSDDIPAKGGRDIATPIANDDLAYAVQEDSILRVSSSAGVLDNDTDGDGDTLAASLTILPHNPLFDFKTNGSFVFDARYHGTLWVTGDALSGPGGGAVALPNGFNSLAAGAVVYDSFTYAANDGQDSDTATVRIAITGVNDNPTAGDDSATFNQASDTTVSIDVLANDGDVDVWPTPDVLTIVALSDVADEPGAAGGSDTNPNDGLTIQTKEGGTVTLGGGLLSYTAGAGFFGIDSFEYLASDGNGGTDTGLVRITVLPANLGPDAANDTRQIGEDAGATLLSTVLVNDTDADDAPLIAADLVLGIGGALRRVDASGNTILGATGTLVDFNSDGTFTYDPSGAFEALGLGESAYVAFDYTAYDGHGASDQAIVTIEIQGANDNPTGVSPDAVTVYEAGLASGSGDGDTTIVRLIDISFSDADASDLPFIAGTTGGSTATLTGTYGTLEFVDGDTVRYTLTTKADHAAVQGHNGGITDSFTVYAVDGKGGASGPLTVTANVVDDINFLGVLPNGGVGNAVDDKTVAFTANATVSDSFTLVPGADGQTLDVVGKPGDFTLADGRVVTSAVYLDASGREAIRGTTADGSDADTLPDVFYELTFNPDPDSSAATALGEYTLKVFQSPPSVTNNLDFSALGAGGPQEAPVVDNIRFNGGFFTNGANIVGTFTDPGNSTTADDINPNNAGGIGIGNGNIERLEVLQIDVSGSSGQVSAIEFDVEGVGGGIGTGDILWEAVKLDNSVVRGFVTVDLTSTTGAHTIRVEPGVEFASLYVALDPADFDANDKMRINRIATIEEVASDDIALRFAINSDDGDGDHSPLEAASPSYEEFVVTILGEGSGTIGTSLVPV